jgi:calcineurin-like phosphoesterase family protein
MKVNNYFTSDTHFNHANIIKYSKRPFADVTEMNEALIDNWNAVVGKNDNVYHLGDVGFGDIFKIVRRLNGNKFLIPGNHDKKNLKSEFFKKQWLSIEKEMEISIDGQGLMLSHYAHRTWNKSHRGVYHLYGHSHGSLPDDPNSLSFDVGVDCHNYFPISFEQVCKIMKTKKWKSIDHHGRDDDL